MTQVPAGFFAVMWNVIGGAIVAALTIAFQAIRRKLRRKSFRMIFGPSTKKATLGLSLNLGLISLIFPKLFLTLSKTI